MSRHVAFESLFTSLMILQIMEVVMNICDLCRFSATTYHARGCELVLQMLSTMSAVSRILN